MAKRHQVSFRDKNGRVTFKAPKYIKPKKFKATIFKTGETPKDIQVGFSPSPYYFHNLERVTKQPIDFVELFLSNGFITASLAVLNYLFFNSTTTTLFLFGSTITFFFAAYLVQRDKQ